MHKTFAAHQFQGFFKAPNGFLWHGPVGHDLCTLTFTGSLHSRAFLHDAQDLGSSTHHLWIGYKGWQIPQSLEASYGLQIRNSWMHLKFYLNHVNLRIVEHIRYWMYQSEYIKLSTVYQHINPSFFYRETLVFGTAWPNWKRWDKECTQNDIVDDAHLQFLGGMERIHDFNFQLLPPSSFKDGWQVRSISKWIIPVPLPQLTSYVPEGHSDTGQKKQTPASTFVSHKIFALFEWRHFLGWSEMNQR